MSSATHFPFQLTGRDSFEENSPWKPVSSPKVILPQDALEELTLLFLHIDKFVLGLASLALSKPSPGPENVELQTQRLLDLLQIQKAAFGINKIQSGDNAIPRDTFHDRDMLEHWDRANIFILPLVPTWHSDKLRDDLLELCQQIDDIPSTLFCAAQQGLLTRKTMHGVRHRVSLLSSLFSVIRDRNAPLANLVMFKLRGAQTLSRAKQKEVTYGLSYFEKVEVTQPFSWIALRVGLVCVSIKNCQVLQTFRIMNDELTVSEWATYLLLGIAIMWGICNVVLWIWKHTWKILYWSWVLRMAWTVFMCSMWLLSALPALATGLMKQGERRRVKGCSVM